MNRASLRRSLLPFLVVGTLLSLAHPSNHRPRDRASEPAREELLERARLEQELILAERTAVMLGELIAAEEAERDRGGER